MRTTMVCPFRILTVVTLLTATVAQAESAKPSVSVFGLMDANISRYSAGGKSGVGGDTRLQDGTNNGLNGSRWGLKASQDLGDGLTGGAHLEGGYSVADGSLGQGGKLAGRQVFLSLASTSAGELRVGRQYLLGDSVMGLSNPFGNALTLNPGSGVTNKGKSLPFFLNAPRVDYALQYASPKFGGLQAAAQVAPGNSTNTDRFQGVRLGYKEGDLSSALSYEWNKSRISGDQVNKALALSANYDFGVVKLLGGIQRNNDLATGSGNGAFTGSNLQVAGDQTFAATQSNGMTVGAEAPMGNWLVGTNYTKVNYEGATGSSQGLGKFALGARYAMSENLFVYTSASMATGDLKDYIAEKSVIQAGMRFAF